MWQQIALIIFWFCVLAILHSYIIYPFIMCRLAKRKLKAGLQTIADEHHLPYVSVILAAHNEEKVIEEKLLNLLAIRYPKHLLRFYVGSDASTDKTVAICTEVARQHPDLFQFTAFMERRGKPPVVNSLVAQAFEYRSAAPDHILLLTDASVMLLPNTLMHLVKHYRNPNIGCVDAHMTTNQQEQTGVGHSEESYMNRETQLKKCESHAWGMMIGPFGGCYTLRSDLFRPIPPRSLVDDFYLGFGALTQGYQAINELEAKCVERSSQSLTEEYRRKRRIATGSMRNLAIFRSVALRPFSPLGFAFISHKIIRWFGGWLMLTAFCIVLFLSTRSAIWSMILCVLVVSFCLIAALYFLHRRKWLHLPFASHIWYFFAMNLALMHGTLLYLKGIKNDIWEPTRR